MERRVPDSKEGGGSEEERWRSHWFRELVRHFWYAGSSCRRWDLGDRAPNFGSFQRDFGRAFLKRFFLFTAHLGYLSHSTSNPP